MANRTEVKTEVLACNNVFMAHAHCNPVRSWLFYLETDFFDIGSSFQTWLHYRKFIARTIGAFHNQVRNDLYVRVFGGWTEFEAHLFPDVHVFTDVR